MKGREGQIWHGLDARELFLVVRSAARASARGLIRHDVLWLRDGRLDQLDELDVSHTTRENIFYSPSDAPWETQRSLTRLA